MGRRPAQVRRDGDAPRATASRSTARVNTEGVGAQDLPLAAGDEAPRGRAPRRLRARRSATWRSRAGSSRASRRRPTRRGSRTTTEASKAGRQAARHRLRPGRDRPVHRRHDGRRRARRQRRGAQRGQGSGRDEEDAREVRQGGRRRRPRVRRGRRPGRGDRRATATSPTSAWSATCSSPPADARRARRRSPTVEPKPVSGAKGAVVFVADGEAIAKAVLERSGQDGGRGPVHRAGRRPDRLRDRRAGRDARAREAEDRVAGRR